MSTRLSSSPTSKGHLVDLQNGQGLRSVYVKNTSSDQPGSCTKECVFGEYAFVKQRLWIALGFTLPAILIGIPMGARNPETIRMFPPDVVVLGQLVLSAPVVFWAAWSPLRIGWLSADNGRLNKFTPMLLGTTIAFAYSLVVTLCPSLLPGLTNNTEGPFFVYFDAAALIATLALLIRTVEMHSRLHGTRVARAIRDLGPTEARLIDEDGTERMVPLSRVTVNSKLLVGPGERIPVDGVILEGHTIVDESIFPGLPEPVAKAPGDDVTVATLNLSDTLILRAGGSLRNELLTKIAEEVDEAQRSRTSLQRRIDAVSRYYVPTVIFVAFLTFAFWFLVGPEPRMAHAVASTVAVLVIGNPILFELAEALSVSTGIGRGAIAGMLIRNADTVEKLSRVDTLLVNMAGTLTVGEPRVVSIVPEDGSSDVDLLHVAASAECGSKHPLAGAIVAAARSRGISLSECSGTRRWGSKGVTAKIDGRSVAVGNRALLMDVNVSLGKFWERAESLRRKGQTVIFVAIGGRVTGLIGLADSIRDSTRDAVAALREKNVHLVVATGDSRATAQAVAQSLQLHEVRADLLPERKASILQQFRAERRTLAIASNEIHDAAWLTQADVSVAIGASTLAGTADVKLCTGDLRSIARVLRLSQLTMRNLRQNVCIALGYNVFAVAIAAGALYPACGLLVWPTIAAALLSLSIVFVVGNAVRLRYVDLSLAPSR